MVTSTQKNIGLIDLEIVQTSDSRRLSPSAKTIQKELLPPVLVLSSSWILIRSKFPSFSNNSSDFRNGYPFLNKRQLAYRPSLVTRNHKNSSLALPLEGTVLPFTLSSINKRLHKGSGNGALASRHLPSQHLVSEESQLLRPIPFKC